MKACLPLAAAVLWLPAALGAQEPADTLAERLLRAEEAIERLQRGLEEMAQSRVQSRSRNRVELSGLVLVNGFHNSARVNNSDVPQFVVPRDTSGLPNSHLGGAIRQTRLGVALSGTRALGADLSAGVEMDFFGGQQASTGGRTHPLARVRTAVVRLDWSSVGILLGQEAPLVSGLNPVSVASTGLPGYAGAGNLWLWIPQARMTIRTGTGFRAGVQAAALAPMTPSPQGAFLTQPDSAEKSGRPTFQARTYIGWGQGDTFSEFGLGMHRGWIAGGGDTLILSSAYTTDWRLSLGRLLLVHGEFFFEGQALAGLGGGGIGQNLGPGGVPVPTRGGWVQLNVRPSPMWEWGGGFGMDDPDESVLPVTGRGRNVAYTGHLHWRPGGGLLLGFEYRRMETRYAAGTLSASHLNWFAGVSF